MQISAKKLFFDFYNLLVPRKCLNCGKNLNLKENQICLDCIYNIPKTNYLDFIDNPANQIFWGRININFASALYFFTKNSALQDLIHQIKYSGKKELAYELGKQIAFGIKKSEFYSNLDFIFPVPLHPKKFKKRGYNQSEWIAKGISEILKIPLETSILIKTKNTKSQTNKNRLERLENVSSVFSLSAEYLSFKSKHILVVDDVLTTGATIEACCIELLKIPESKISVITLAIAGN
ncbi:MAG: ComF family protein [Bacteroidales bacterium]|nr:ComF family protein [Bacteroidales bacterium]MBN2756780.1 ComF family protein [Bacteroidales bacterium]